MEKQSRYLTMEEWILKMWFIYIMESYSAIKNEDILSFAGKWMEVENIILSEITQTQKDLYGLDSLWLLAIKVQNTYNKINTAQQG